MSDNIMEKVQSFISKTAKAKLTGYTVKTKMPISRLIAIAIERELLGPDPFAYDLTLPEESIEFAYAEEAGKILTYLKQQQYGMGLDMLCLVREDIGIPDKLTFLAAFGEVLRADLLETFTPKPKMNAYTEFPQGYVYYKLKTAKGEETPRKKRNKKTRLQRYEKLKKEFGDG